MPNPARSASLWLSMFSLMVSSNMTTPIVGIYATLRLNADPVTVGAIYGAQTITAFLFRLPAVWLSSKIGLANMMLAGLIAVSIGGIIYTVASSPFQLIVGGLVRGLGSGAYHPAVLSYVYSEAGENGRRSGHLGYMLSAPPLGMILGPAIGAAVFTLAGYTASFISAAAIPLAASGVLYLYGPANDDVKPTFSLKDMAQRRFAALLMSRLIVNYVAGTISAFLPLLVHTYMGLSEQAVFLLFSLAAAFNLMARFMSGPISAWIGEDWMLTSGSLLVAISALFMVWAMGAMVWVGMAVYGVGIGYFVISSVALVGQMLQPAARPLGFAFMTSMIDLGNGLGNLVSGLLLDRYGFTAVFATAALIGVLGTLLDMANRIGRRQFSMP